MLTCLIDFVGSVVVDLLYSYYPNSRIQSSRPDSDHSHAKRLDTQQRHCIATCDDERLRGYAILLEDINPKDARK
jgi:hypothetical protein